MSYTHCNTECDDGDDHLAAVLDTIVEEKEKEDNGDTKFDDDGNEKAGGAANGISATANADFMPRIHNDGTTKYPMPMDIESSDGIIRDRRHQGQGQRQGQVSHSQQNMHDFLTCCLAQFWCGILGSGIVWCSNSHRRNYPTRPAFWGFWTAIFVMLFIYFSASIYSYYSYR
eukprot:CAMPEP_0113502746 /NCGR_PEP_ID=MMETSP0014_2-20120614/33748_1 /TAXON_ID=2857 /ORGANISM="Nitzschia sp." /LENGTH=171 /DNA_ID=CAMNT_0000397613 /DNA_START=272 /DNA_END=784 /DNA_ORIENTATION=- /assembly_acc=CAM_ASM_000159